MGLLQKAAGELSNGKHPKALGHVNAAIQSLQTAMKKVQDGTTAILNVHVSK